MFTSIFLYIEALVETVSAANQPSKHYHEIFYHYFCLPLNEALWISVSETSLLILVLVIVSLCTAQSQRKRKVNNWKQVSLELTVIEEDHDLRGSGDRVKSSKYFLLPLKDYSTSG